MKLNSIKLCLFLCSLAASVSAQTPLFSDPTGGSAVTYSSRTVGARFTVGSQSIQVSALGVYDYLLDGFSQGISIGLWDASGTLLASNTVPSGTAGTLVGSYRYVTLGTPITLTATATYTLGAYQPNTSYRLILGATITADPAVGSVNFQRYTSSTGPVLAEPNADLGANLAWANLEFNPIPEPSATMILAGGFGLLAFIGWRRKSKA